MKKRSHHPWPKSTLFVLVLLFGMVGAGAKIGFTKDQEIREAHEARAERIFRYDRNVKHLPANRVYALSVALRFGDRDETESMLRELESRMGH